ncbi:OstA-like protein [Roseimicrobium gellanilyticum]|uniref:OstA-like protein n=1 Tax=Roseimicrobium gellanilyticum TaxID=748857 RepID=A0A366HPX1_9BACT|nr:LptA/OstA family protein [Roseimicrobium gellanilyticum]RBP44571.1 OstA-like protein [Roseimicrobium gellanilyticum]
MKLTLITTCCVLAAASQAVAQAGRNGFPVIRSREAMKSAQEAARVLTEAKANGIADLQRKAQELPQAQRMETLVSEARQSSPTQPSFSDQAHTAESTARMESAMSRLAPEGQILLAQSNTSPAMRSPDDVPVASPAVKASPLTTAGGGPKPQPLKPTPLEEKPKTPPQETVINSQSSFFDSREGFGVFVENVVVNHPQFHLTCDELQVYMNKEEEKGADGKSAATTPPPPKAPTASELAASGAANKPASASDAKPDGNSSLKRAIAKGRKVLINKMSDKGELQTGIGREADYDGKTGDIILRGWPQIQEGRNLTVAKSPSTYFLIKANGQFQSFGPNETRLIQEDDKKGLKGAPNGASVGVAVPPTAPGAGPAPVLNNRTQGGQQ